MRYGKFHILWVILVFASCSREREVPNLVRTSEPGFTGLERCAGLPYRQVCRVAAEFAQCRYDCAE